MTERALAADAHLVDAIRAIEASRRRIAVVVDGAGRLIGTLTDGDVRRCLLGGGTIDTAAVDAMNRSPLSAPLGSSNGYLMDLMRRGNVAAVPLVDADGRFGRLVHMTDIAPSDEVREGASFAFAVIMAGGEGTRLRPITQNIPKPMVDIGGVPLLERQIQRLVGAGLKRVYLSVSYLSHVIEEYFADGAALGIEIRYLREREKLGTGGALSLLPEQPGSPIVVMNGDILTTSDFGSLYTFHRAHKAAVTVAAVDYRIDIPYGVITNDGPFVTRQMEKPSQRFLCNAGIYAVSPDALTLVPRGRQFDMTDLVDECLRQGRPAAVFPVHEYWSDIGTPADLDAARSKFSGDH